MREVQIKAWGAGGGGCRGGFDKENDQIYYIRGHLRYIEVNLRLPIGETIKITVGQGGNKDASQSDSLGGLGGSNGGNPGRDDGASGGGEGVEE